MKKHLIPCDDDTFMELLIGTNQRENDTLIKNSHQNDLWFHLENMSGPHFVLRIEDDMVPTKRQLYQIASLFSQYKTGLGRNYRVIYTEIKNVTRTKTPGQVIVKNKKIISI